MQQLNQTQEEEHRYGSLHDTDLFKGVNFTDERNILILPGCYSDQLLAKRAQEASKLIQSTNYDQIITLGGTPVSDSNGNIVSTNKEADLYLKYLGINEIETDTQSLTEKCGVDTVGQALIISHIVRRLEEFPNIQIELLSNAGHNLKLWQMISRMYGKSPGILFHGMPQKGSIDTFTVGQYFDKQYSNVPRGNLEYWLEAVNNRHNFYSRTKEGRRKLERDSPRFVHVPESWELEIPEYLR